MLQAAASVDYLPFRAQVQVNMPFGVWRSLVARGYLRHHSYGWIITPEGRAVITGGHVAITRRTPKRRKPYMVDGKLPRYRVSRTLYGWAVMDRSKPKISVDNNVVEVFKSRTNARLKALELNLEETRRMP